MAVLRCGRARFARGDRSEAAAVVPLDMPGFLRSGKNFFPRKLMCLCVFVLNAKNRLAEKMAFIRPRLYFVLLRSAEAGKDWPCLFIAIGSYEV